MSNPSNTIHPIVSVIIIFLNEEKYIEEAITSVLNQTYANWELLLVDDGSTDQSSKIARSYGDKYPDQIYYLEHPEHQNRGMSASRNLGISQSRGEYISFLDGDDVWLPNKLARQLELLASQAEAVMVYGPLLSWFSWTGDPKDQEKDFLYGLESPSFRLKGDKLYAPPELLTHFIRHEDLIPSGVLITKHALLEAGGYVEVFKGNYEDAVLLIKVCLKNSVYVSNESWYKYRQHPDSYTTLLDKSGQTSATNKFYLDWIKQYFTDQKVTDKELWQALETAFLPYRNPLLYKIQKNYYYLIGKFEKYIIKVGKTILPEKFRRWLWSQWINFKIKAK